MNRQYIILFFIFFSVLSLADCSSSEKRVTGSAAKQFKVKNMDIVKVPVETAGTELERSAVLKKPADFRFVKPEVMRFSNNDIDVILYARMFAQGNGVYAEIVKKDKKTDPQNLKIMYKDINVTATSTPWGFRALWGIHPEEKPGKIPVIVSYTLDGGGQKLSAEILVRDIEFPVSKSMLNVGKFSNKDYTTDPKYKKLISECSALRSKAFNTVSPDRIQGAVSHPRDAHKITGDYWRKRTYLTYHSVKKKGKKKKIVQGKKSYHRGVDLKGEIGAPVFSIADGVVVLSHKMFFEGDMVVVDHGNRVFSYYQHLDSRTVKTGDKVKAGDIIGGVGATGMVTGPHLHVAFSINVVHVDPLSILSLPLSR